MPLEFDGVNGIIKNTTSDGDITIKGNDGGSEISALTFDMSTAGKATFNNDIALGDSQKAVFGASEDLQIYHDGSHSYISDQGTGDLRILAANSFVVKKADASENIITANADGAVGLSYDASQKLATTSTGIEINGGFTATAASTITTADNSDNLTLKSTDADANAGPNLILQRDSGSPADGDAIGRIDFDADNDAGEVTSFFSIRAEIEDASDGTEDGQMKIDQMIAGTAVTALRFKSSETVFNDDSKDVDFRVEGNGDANLLFVDAGNDKIGIGTNSPAKLLSLKKDGGGGAIGIDIHNQGTDAADDALITFETQGHRNYSMGIDRSESAFVVMSEADGLGTARLTIDDSGDAIFSGTVGVPALDIMSGSSIHGTITTSSSSLTLNARNTGIMIFQSGGTERMRIGSDGATTITTTGNEDTLSLTSTDADANVGPNLRLYRNSSSPADNDALGFIEFEGRNDNSQDVIYGSLEATLLDASDGTEDGELVMRTMIAGTKTNQLMLKPEGFIFNENSADLDFRVESNGNANMLMVNGGSNLVGIGADPDLGAGLHIKSGDSGGSAHASADELVVEASGSGGIQILTANDQLGRLYFGDDGSTHSGFVTYDHANNKLEFGTQASTRAVIDSSGKVGIGETSSPLGNLHIKSADSGASAGANADELVIENSGDAGLSILSGNGSSGTINFADDGANNRGIISYDHSADSMKFGTAGTVKARFTSGGALSLNDSSPDVDAGGLCLNQGANDAKILTFKSSDVAHGMTDVAETDTYAVFKKRSSDGGLQINALHDSGDQGMRLEAMCVTENTTKGTTGNGPMHLASSKKNSAGLQQFGTNANLLVVSNNGSTKFIVDAEGELHSDGGAQSAYDTYEDAQLVRAYDLSHGKGVIDSKFDDYIKYNHESLAEAGLVGREKDGTPNHFINVTGFQRLHNGAIWQQYEKHQRLASAFYKLAEKTIGKEEADKLLTEEEIQLLN
jgi:hypothetical protein